MITETIEIESKLIMGVIADVLKEMTLIGWDVIHSSSKSQSTSEGNILVVTLPLGTGNTSRETQFKEELICVAEDVVKKKVALHQEVVTLIKDHKFKRLSKQDARGYFDHLLERWRRLVFQFNVKCDDAKTIKPELEKLLCEYRVFTSWDKGTSCDLRIDEKIKDVIPKFIWDAVKHETVLDCIVNEVVDAYDLNPDLLIMSTIAEKLIEEGLPNNSETQTQVMSMFQKKWSDLQKEAKALSKSK